MAKSKKTFRPKARLPKGMRDIDAGEIRIMNDMLAKVAQIYDSYGFEPLETPAFEYTEALGKFLPDQERPNAGVFSFQDEDEQWLSLRYDLTAPLARHVAEHYDRLAKPFRRYAWGPVWRNETPGPGRFRQFTQFDADTVGTKSVAADAELCMLAADVIEALGIARGDYVIKLNNRKIFDGVLDAAGLSGDDKAATRLTALRAIDKYDRLGKDGVKLLLGPGRKDASGDFTPGAGLPDPKIDLLMKYIYSGQGLPLKDVTDDPAEVARLGNRVMKFSGFEDEENGNAFFVIDNNFTITNLRKKFGKNHLASSGIDELEIISDLVKAAGYDEERIIIDPTVVRGLEYYTGPVFEAELTFEAKDDKGRPVRFGSVGGGGRYDGLVARFKGIEVPATGFSLGVSRLLSALIHLQRVGQTRAPGPVVVLVMDFEDVPRYQRLAQTLRQAGIRAEMYLGTSGMKAQMKYADKRGSPCVIIQGEDEIGNGNVQIKDLIQGSALSKTITSSQEWRAANPAQIEVGEDELVRAVRKVLSRHFD